MDKKGKHQGRYGGGQHGGKTDDNGRFVGREESSVNRRLRQDQASTFSSSSSGGQQRQHADDWMPGGSRANSFQRDKKPPIAGNPALPNLPSNIESYPVSWESLCMCLKSLFFLSFFFINLRSSHLASSKTQIPPRSWSTSGFFWKAGSFDGSSGPTATTTASL